MPSLDPRTLSKLDIPVTNKVLVNFNKSTYLKSILNNIANVAPELSIEWVWLNPKSIMTMPFEFFIVTKKYNEKIKGNQYSIFCGILFSNSSLSGYKYCYEHSQNIVADTARDMLSQWYYEFFDNSINLPFDKFNALLEAEGCCANIKRPNNYKKPENAEKVSEAFKNGFMIYKKNK